MPTRPCHVCPNRYYVTGLLDNEPCPYCGQIPLSTSLIGPMHDQPSIPGDHIVRIATGPNIETTYRRSSERVTFHDYRYYNYADSGWRIISVDVEPNRTMTIVRNRGQRMETTLSEFERYYSRDGWREFIARELPPWDEDDAYLCESCAHRCATPYNHISGDDQIICESCWDEFVTCNVCRESFHEDDCNSLVNGGWVCESERGYQRCSDCSDYDRGYNMYSVDHHRSVCGTCSGDYATCDNCSTLMGRDTYGDYCESCQSDRDEDYDREDSSPYVRSYCHKPNPKFHGSDSSLVPYLGIEIEIGTNGVLNACAELAHNKLGGLGYLKSDCSITDHYSSGFELVTHPMTHAYTLESFPYDALEEMESMGADASMNGIHVHVSRAGFSDTEHTYRWLRLLMSNKDHCLKIARRDSDQWATFREFNSDEARYMAEGGSYRRYEAINSENDDTFELRMFAGSLDRTEVQSAFDLTHASVEYTRDNECPDWHSFTAWLTSQGDTYAALIAQNGK